MIHVHLRMPDLTLKGQFFFYIPKAQIIRRRLSIPFFVLLNYTQESETITENNEDANFAAER